MQRDCKEISKKYCFEYPFNRKVEDFGIFEDLECKDSIILSGSTKLPGEELGTLFEVANYWLRCLTEITKILTNATWDASFDDVDLIYDIEEGWRFPTDEEY